MPKKKKKKSREALASEDAIRIINPISSPSADSRSSADGDLALGTLTTPARKTKRLDSFDTEALNSSGDEHGADESIFQLEDEMRENEERNKELMLKIRALRSGRLDATDVAEEKLSKLITVARYLYLLNIFVSPGGCWGQWRFRQLRGIRDSSAPSGTGALADIAVVVVIGVVPTVASALAMEAVTYRHWKHLIGTVLLQLCVMLLLSSVVAFTLLVVADISDPIAKIGSKTFSSPERRIETWRTLECQRTLAPSQCHDDFELALQTCNLQPTQIERVFGDCSALDGMMASSNDSEALALAVIMCGVCQRGCEAAMVETLREDSMVLVNISFLLTLAVFMVLIYNFCFLVLSNWGRGGVNKHDITDFLIMFQKDLDRMKKGSRGAGGRISKDGAKEFQLNTIQYVQKTMVEMVEKIQSSKLYTKVPRWMIQLAMFTHGTLLVCGLALGGMAVFAGRLVAEEDCPGDTRCEVDLIGYFVWVGFGFASYAALAYTCIITPGFDEMSHGNLGHSKKAFLRGSVLAGFVMVTLLLVMSTTMTMLATGSVGSTSKIGADGMQAARDDYMELGIESDGDEFTCIGSDSNAACIMKIDRYYRHVVDIVLAFNLAAGAYSSLLIVLTLYLIDKIRSSLDKTAVKFFG